MKNQWDERYAADEYVYGKEPNDFFKEILKNKEPGRILLPAEGEGRNAVYAALLGWEVYAFDSSIEGQKKAMNLANEFGVNITYQVSSFESFKTELKFDMIGLFYFHLLEKDRKIFFGQLPDMLTESGVIIGEFFHKEQLGRPSGGPPSIEYLYHQDELKEDFPGMNIKLAEKQIINLSEGCLHLGDAAVVRFVAEK